MASTIARVEASILGCRITRIGCLLAGEKLSIERFRFRLLCLVSRGQYISSTDLIDSKKLNQVEIEKI